ncbi:sel1 repeat family protein [Pseudomonas sp. PDM14]|uniref:tetratricopeptide repeat protein n=1 Tax=Pseudomonas sp. PDM14 TaxID=2769288 RepID=UPI0017850A7D|nr:sel1 repeat family protein [Pseudomonas sp. PDM14]MBD9481980.1 sel1 repeat family protein [Pseudomonas sp. PDM14]
MFWRLRARIGYLLARQLFQWRWLVQQPRAWDWMQGQFARMAAQGDVVAQSFYGHLLLFRGQGLGAREEGLRLLRLAAQAGDGKAAYQVGLSALSGDTRHTPDGAEAARWWVMAASASHPLAAHRLAVLYREGGPGLAADASLAAQYERRASELGLG